MQLVRQLVNLIVALAADRQRLAFENVALRQQLVVLKRSVKRAKLEDSDRVFWILIRRLFRDWADHLVIVKPDTVIRWHRKGFKSLDLEEEVLGPVGAGSEVGLEDLGFERSVRLRDGERDRLAELELDGLVLGRERRHDDNAREEQDESATIPSVRHGSSRWSAGTGGLTRGPDDSHADTKRLCQ